MDPLAHNQLRLVLEAMMGMRIFIEDNHRNSYVGRLAIKSDSSFGLKEVPSLKVPTKNILGIEVHERLTIKVKT